MKTTITNKLILSDMPGHLYQTVCERLSFQNPKFIENERMGRWNGDTPGTLEFYHETDDGYLVTPRGFIRQLICLCRRHDVQFKIDDKLALMGY